MDNHIIKFALKNKNSKLNIVGYYGKMIIIEDGESNMKDLIKIDQPTFIVNDVNKLLDEYLKEGYVLEDFTAI
jgi:hypothetical protein